MYQPEIKQRFITEFTSGKDMQDRIRRLFQSFESAEQAAGTDLTLLPAETLQKAFSAGNGLRSSAAEDMLYVLRAYYKWRIQNNLPAEKSVFVLTTDDLGKVFDQMVGSPLHLLQKLDNVFDLPEEETVHCVYRTYLWLAFIGVEEEDVVHIKTKDVRLSAMTLTYGGRTYELPRESLLDFTKTCRLTSFNFDNRHYQMRRDRAPGDYLLRTIRMPQFSLASSRVLVSQMLNRRACDPSGRRINEGYKLSYGRIALSGVFYRAYERERIGLDPGFQELVNAEIDPKIQSGEYKLGKYRTPNKIKNQRLRAYQKDYRRWKLVFVIH